MIIKVKKFPSTFVQIHKFPINEDSRLSWRAKGILVYLIGHSNDWKTRIENITNHAKDGISSVRAGLKELKELGYAKCYPTRDEKGKITDWNWEVCEVPIYSNRPEVEIHILDKTSTNKDDYPEVEIHILDKHAFTRSGNSYSGQVGKKPMNKASYPEYEKPHSGKSHVTKKREYEKKRIRKKENKKPVFNDVKEAYSWAESLGVEDSIGVLFEIGKLYPSNLRKTLTNIWKAPQAQQRLVELYQESQAEEHPKYG